MSANNHARNKEQRKKQQRKQRMEKRRFQAQRAHERWSQLQVVTMPLAGTHDEAEDDCPICRILAGQTPVAHLADGTTVHKVNPETGDQITALIDQMNSGRAMN